MPKTFWAWAVVGLLAGSLAAGLCRAADGGVTATNSYIVWDTQKEELLPQSSVIAMTQTRDGYLWLGTMKGLVRFDGMRTEVFDEFNAPGLGDKTVVHLFADSHGGLWVGTEKSGVVLIKDGQVTGTGFGGGPGGRLVSSSEDASGAVWLYTADGRLARFRNGQMEHTWPVDFGFSGCRSVITENSGQVWIGTDTNLYRVVSELRAGSLSLVLQSNAVPKQDFLLASRAGGFWQFAEGRIRKIRTNQVEHDLGAYSWSQLQNPVTAACEDARGNLFVGTWGDGVYRYDAQGGVTRIASPEVLNHNTILSLCLDREGSLWIGTDGGGASRIKPQPFQVAPESAGRTIQLACDDARGGLWFSFNGGVLNYWKDGTFNQFGPAQGLENVNVRAVLVDHNQTVWVGGIFGGGLFQLTNGMFRFAPGTEAIRPQVSTLLEDHAGQVWVGTQDGLARWDGQAWKTFTTRDGLPDNAVRVLAEDAQGNLWIGTESGGLSSLRDGKFTSHQPATGGLSGQSITALLADQDGTLWIGTSGGGLLRLRDNQWKSYTKHDGLAGNSISYLIEDGAGFLWIGSNEGLMRAEKKALDEFEPGRAESLQVRTFGKADGLPTKECTSGSQPAACRARTGMLWFPTTKGLVGVNPAELSRNTNPPPVVVESVLVDDQPQNTNAFQVSWARDIIVPADKERLEIHYTSLNLAAPERARFKYRLAGEGRETKWIDAGELREVQYTRLPPGRYRFQVTACNEDGVWNPTPAQVTIVVEPPFWKKPWFVGLASLGLLGVVVGTVYFISTQKLQRQLAHMRQQEALEKERSRIARDLHDQLGANLTQVALLGEMAESDKDLPQEVEAHAQQIAKTARETSNALDEIVWAANPQNDTLEGLVNYACKYAQDYLALAGLRYRLEVPTHLPVATIPPDLRHNVFLAFKESVNNVVKHARASEVKIRLRLDGNTFSLEVEDDGRGPGEAATKTGRNGLRNMRQRMEDVGGGFSMEPGLERGTIVRLISPIGKH